MRRCAIFLTTLIVINTIFLPTVKAESNDLPSIRSEAAIIMEADSEQILYEKNADSLMYPASLTKIMTSIYAIENGDLNDIVTISNNASARNVEGTTVFLEEGEKVRLETLIKGFLINSGNDAGVAIAEYLSGSEEQFAQDINKYLKKVVGVENTHLKNPHGLFDPEHVTTAEDLAKITNYAIENETFAEIFGTKELEWNGKAWDTTIITHHKILKGEIPYEHITGGKNGFVHESGYTLATTAENEDLSLIVITLKSNDRNGIYDDTINLLNYGFDHYETSYIAEDTSFNLEGDQYITPEKLAYTHLLNNEVEKQVTSNGELDIVNNDEKVIQSFKLNKIEAKEDKSTNLSHNENKKSQDEVQLNDIPLGQILVVTILILMVIGAVYRKVK
ncbi:D-alanyl-D-alanine carboxypeptidase family protein [Gracilibacillus suaedae]|uniref:D-alanyl-D-alanine carboxypeptidase family protein n=1 Tax=Gracilibacillus suaedae TaxID=2820273 RepID=UPI001ABE1324|nr:D-alanyl-D-alanine carboxypeptidase family protein [Gracilibacillus suaedae]